jgi:hypothetical protein
MTMAHSERKRLFVRQEAAHPMTPLKLRLLGLVGECGILTLPQLAALADLSEKSARDHARDLFDWGLVERLGVPRAALAPVGVDGPELLWGRAPTIYTLSRAGGRLLGIRDVPPAYGPKNALFLAHEVAVRDVRVWLERLRREHGHPGLSLWRHGAAAHLGRARPDALFVYAFPGATLTGLVEIDRGTERSPIRWQEKFARYAPLFANETIERATGQKRGRVLVTAPDARRRDAIVKVLESCLPGSGVPTDRFWVSEHAALEQTDLRAAQWRVVGRDGLLPLVPAQVL